MLKPFLSIEISPDLVLGASNMHIPFGITMFEFQRGIVLYPAIVLTYKTFFDEDEEYYHFFTFAFDGQKFSSDGSTLSVKRMRETLGRLKIKDKDFKAAFQTNQLKTCDMILSLEEALTHPNKHVRAHAFSLKDKIY